MIDSVRHVRYYSPKELEKDIDWSYFLFAWGIRNNCPQAASLCDEAAKVLRRLQDEGATARAVYTLRSAWSDGDDLVLPANGKMPEARLCFLRQQHTCEEKPCLCLADFIAPRTATSVPLSARYIGIFATTAGLPEDFPHDVASVYHRSEVCPCCNPQLLALRRRLTPQHRPEQGSGEEDVYEKMMRQTLFDRLAEAAAVRVHDELLKCFEPEPVNTEVRPAVGYPSMPDQSLIFDLDRLLPLESIGIRLTENGMMIPHAATCGLVFAHPAARYFDVGYVSQEQLADYAHRRHCSVESLQRFFASRRRC